jgi:hypothetical protein
MDPGKLAGYLVRQGLLTEFQARQVLAGRHRGLILGPYRIKQPLGKGGMGTVFLAEHAALCRQVALKLLPPDKADSPVDVERFYREGRAAARLDHPNIVRVHDIARAGGVHFMVMEYVEGQTLQSLIEQGSLSPARAAQFVAQAAAGLWHAHEAGIVHRDVKPANLMLDRQGCVKILDMGLARSFVHDHDGVTRRFGQNIVVGTPDYIAPEQVFSETPDPRSDIYSLGATFFALLAGRPPFQGSLVHKLAQHQTAPPPALDTIRPDVPPPMQAVVERMLAKDPGARYQDAAEVIEALGAFLPGNSGETVHIRLSNTRPVAVRTAPAPESPREPSAALEAAPRGPPQAPAGQRAPRHWPWSLAGSAAAGVVLTGVVLGLALRGGRRVGPPPDPAGAQAMPHGGSRYQPLDLRPVATACTAKGLVTGDGGDRFVLDQWGLKLVYGVPFDVADPKQDRPNVVVLWSPNSELSRRMPRSVTIPAHCTARAYHILGGVAAWAVPFTPAKTLSKNWAASPKGSVSATIRLHFDDGSTEDHPLRNGEHLTDPSHRFDVPGSRFAFLTKNGQQVRYLAVVPSHEAEVRKLELIKGEGDNTAPIFLAVTAEVVEGR